MASAPEPQQMGNASGGDSAKAALPRVTPADPQGVEKCVYNIPCVGGCCAPTVNPDPSCARRGSNEFTLPASGIYLKAAPVIEYSPCCILCGRLGLGFFARNRSGVMCFAFVISFIGWILTGFSAIALSSEPSVIGGMAHWASGELVVVESGEAVMKFYIGVQSRVESIDCGAALNKTMCVDQVTRGIGFSNSHDDVYIRGTKYDDEDRCSAEVPADMPEQARIAVSRIGSLICGECKKSATASMQLLILALITQIPQMTTDLQRRTTFGDVNCQSGMGAATSIFGALSTLGSLTAFSSACFDGLPRDIPGVEVLEMRWNAGMAFSCLWIATCLKLIDAALHILVPTPKARWQKPPVQPNNLEEFLMLGV